MEYLYALLAILGIVLFYGIGLLGTVSREYHEQVVKDLQAEIDLLKRVIAIQDLPMPKKVADNVYLQEHLGGSTLIFDDPALSDPKHDNRIAKMLRKTLDNATKRAESFTDNLSKTSSVTVAEGAWNRQEPVSFRYGCVCTLRESCPNCAPDNYDGPNFFTRNED